MKMSFREHETPKIVCFFRVFLGIKFERIETENVRVKLGLRAKHLLPCHPRPREAVKYFED